MNVNVFGRRNAQEDYWRDRYHKERTLRLQLMERFILLEQEVVKLRKNQNPQVVDISEFRSRLAGL